MSIQVTRTKVILPRRRSDLLTRQRLLDFLYELLDYRLLILSAPAGYGKTSLLVDFAHQVEMPVCWYALDLLDRDLPRFLAHFITAISQQFPDFGSRSLAILESANQADLDIDMLVGTIVNDAYEHIREHFLVVLDDYHLVNDVYEIDLFVNRFIQDVDENCHLILSSRTLLTLPDMPLLVARSQTAGLSFEELAFQPEEIQNLVLQNYQVTMPESVAKELVQETEGWITGLLLSAQSMWQGMADRLRLARVSGVGLYDYLAQQVLDQQPSDIKDFLLRTSMLEEFDARLCEDVFEDEKDYPRLIETVLKNNLFVITVGEEGSWVRYHHLFRDFLQSRLEDNYPEVKDNLLRRMVAVYSRQGEWEKSYSACLRLNDEVLITQLIEQAGSMLVKSGRIALLADWIDALPEDMLESHPKLLSLGGVAEVIRGRPEEGLVLLNQAERVLRKNEDKVGLSNTLVRRATAYRFLGKYQLSLQDANEALSTAQISDQHDIQAGALREIGMSLHQMGQLNGSIEKLGQSLEIYQGLKDKQNISRVQMELGLAHMNAGGYKRAQAYYEDALHYWREVNNGLEQTTFLNNLGVLNYLKGDYEHAGELFEEALALSKQTGYIRMEAYILCGIGDLYAALGANKAAQDAYSQARDIAQKLDYRFLLNYIDIASGTLHRAVGKFDQAYIILTSIEDRINKSGSGYEHGLWELEASQLNAALGQPDKAIGHLSNALELFKKGGQEVEVAKAHLYLAKLYHENKNDQACSQHLKDALWIVEKQESPYSLMGTALAVKGVLEAVKEDAALKSRLSRLLTQINKFENEIPSLRRQLRPHAHSVPFIPPMLTIKAFGKSQVELNGKVVSVSEWQNQRKVRELFFYLLAHPEGLTKEAIGVILWPESTPTRLKLQFKNAIYRLRYALGQDIILFEGERYWFNQDLDYEYDVKDFQEKILLSQQANTVEEKIAAYQCAVDLYQGPYLPDIEGSWAEPDREKYRRRYIEATLNVARLYLESGQLNATLEHCYRILAQDDCQEEACRLAMRAHAAQGNQAAIIQQYQNCVKALFDRMKAYPSKQTEQLYNSLLH
jgi:LuxR family maltose regulon positive regulatory protein